MDVKDLLIKALYEKENKRPRSTQVQIGPSELGSCRRKVWYKLHNQPETNENELKLAAIMGTAIHDTIEKALSNNKEVLLEQSVENTYLRILNRTKWIGEGPQCASCGYTTRR